MGKKLFSFYVNLAKICTDISLETHKNRTWLNRTAKERMENLSDRLLPLFCPRIRKEMYNEKISEYLASFTGVWFGLLPQLRELA
jgi:hypothetical protein